MSTRAQMRSNLSRRLVSRTDLLTADLDAYLDAGLLDLCTRRAHIHTLERTAPPITSSIGGASYARPAGSFSILYLEDTVNQRILTRFPAGMEEYLRVKQNTTSTVTDIPTHFTEWGDSFFVYKTPQVSTISWTPYVYVYPTLGGGDAATPDIPTDWCYAIELVAAEHAFRDLGDEERATKLSEEFQRWLAMRDTTRRQTARFNPARGGGIRPHPDYLRSRFWQR